jgi:ribosome maturation factor RimP
VRFAGQEAQLRPALAVNGQRNFTGVLAGVRGGPAEAGLQRNAMHEFELDQVDKARLVPKY